MNSSIACADRAACAERSGRPVRVDRDRLRSVCALLALLSVLVGACDRHPDATAHTATLSDAYAADLEAWHHARTVQLRAPDGWLSLIGLFWLKPGTNPVGTSIDDVVRLPAARAPADIGVFDVEIDDAPDGGTIQRVTFTPAPAAEVVSLGAPIRRTIAVHTDRGGRTPTPFEIGALSFSLIQRGTRIGVRLRDRDSAARRSFTGVPRYPVDVSWCLTARYTAHRVPQRMMVTSVAGYPQVQIAQGYATFERDGVRHRLDVLSGARDRRYLLFSDATSGTGSFGGGRLLEIEAPATDGRLLLDFNRAYNPPCAFSDYTTCPVPTASSKLDVAIEAGEKAYRRPRATAAHS